MHARYMPWPVYDGWTILDWRKMELCRLPVKAPEGHTTWPLVKFGSRAAADAYLQNCYITWNAWEKNGAPEGAEVPAEWRPRPGKFGRLL